MTYPAYFITNDESGQREKVGNGLPIISEGLDSVRAYQFELHFELPPDLTDPNQDKLTLAAKQVTTLGFATESIEVHRVNDKVFYPGKASPEEVTVTFDNLYQPHIANQLWRWFASIYNPVTGKFNGNGGNFKANKCILSQLDAQGQPIMETRLFGIYPTSWKTAEFNYSTNDFHTIEMTFRYDFMEQADADTGIPATAGI
jgi:hypothetical protein